MLKRRQAIEPIIVHLKQDHRMDRCHLKGETGDRLHAVLCAAGYNLIHPDGTGAFKKTGHKPLASPEAAGTPRFIWLPRMLERP
jgi:hypothetical protein